MGAYKQQVNPPPPVRYLVHTHARAAINKIIIIMTSLKFKEILCLLYSALLFVSTLTCFIYLFIYCAAIKAFE